MHPRPRASEKIAGTSTRPPFELWQFVRRCLVAVVVLFWAALLARNWSELSSFEWSLHAGWAAASVLTFCVYFLGLGAGWVFVGRSMGYAVPIANGLGVWLLSMPARYVPGNLWHVAARVRLAADHRVPPEGVLVSSAVEQALTVVSAACLGLAWLPSPAGQGSIISVVGLFLAGLVILQPPVLRVLLRAGSRLVGRPSPVFSLGYGQVARALAWYGLVNAANGTAFFLLVLASPAEGLSWAQWPLFASAYSLAYVVGYASFVTPSGVGFREAALAAMLGLYVPAALAITLSLLARLLSTIGEVLAVLLVGLPLYRAGQGPPETS